MEAGKIAKAAVFVIACELVGAIGSVFTLRSIATWYPPWPSHGSPRRAGFSAPSG